MESNGCNSFGLNAAGDADAYVSPESVPLYIELAFLSFDISGVSGLSNDSLETTQT